MLQARGVVGHDIGLPWDALCHVAVTVLLLVLRRKDSLLGRCTVCRDGLLADAGLRRGIVDEHSNGGAQDGVALCCGADLGKHAGVLKVTVRDGAIWVGLSAETSLDWTSAGKAVRHMNRFPSAS